VRKHNTLPNMGPSPYYDFTEAHTSHVEVWKCKHFVRSIYQQIRGIISVTQSKHSIYRNIESRVNVCHIKLKVTLETSPEPGIYQICCRSSAFTISTYPTQVSRSALTETRQRHKTSELREGSTFGGFTLYLLFTSSVLRPLWKNGTWSAYVGSITILSFLLLLFLCPQSFNGSIAMSTGRPFCYIPIPKIIIYFFVLFPVYLYLALWKAIQHKESLVSHSLLGNFFCNLEPGVRVLYLFYAVQAGLWSWDSPVGIATRLWVGQPRNRGSIPNRGKRSNVQTSYGAHPVSYPMGTGGCVPGDGGKAAVAWSWPLTSI
jgi:hypothetical protein